MKNKKLYRKVVSIVIALMMLIPIIPNFTNVAAAVVSPSASDIVLDKTAVGTGVDNTYEVNLSVKGVDIVTGKKADVILVIDNSNSMHNTKDAANVSLAEITKNAADAFIDGVLTSANNSSGNVRVAVVQYGQYAKARQFGSSDSWSSKWTSGLNLADKVVYTTDIAKAKSAIDSATTKFENDQDSGGTNTEGGFLMASKVAGEKRTVAESIVIYMTDGLPTYRYDGNSAENDGSWTVNGGSNTSKWELNEAIAAAQALAATSKIYTVALLSAYSSTSNEAKLASNLLSKLPKTYTSNHDTNNIKDQVDESDKWAGTSAYAEKYYPIFSGDDASTEMQEIYGTLAGTINSLAEGSVEDVIPEDFELTATSKAELEAAGVTVTENSDDTTTLLFPNISASQAINHLPEYTVQVKSGVYGVGFTNVYATYNYTLNTTAGTSGSMNFPVPIVAINPTAANDDGYDVNVGENLTVGISENILKNDETLRLQEGGYTVSDLAVEASYVRTITTEEGGIVVLSSDGTFVYTPPTSTFYGTDSFKYKNTATVSGVGTLAGEYVSNEATVKIYVLQLESASYKVEHYLQNADFATYNLEATENLNGVVGELATAQSNVYMGYSLDDTVLGTVSSGTVTSNGDLVLKLYYTANPYNVVYHSNVGTGSTTDSNNYIYGEEVVVLENGFINDGSHFVGWSYGEIEYSPDDTFNMPNSNADLYAIWELDEEEMLDYTVEYYVDGELDETTEFTVPASSPIVSEVSYDNMPEGYYVDGDMSTSLPFTVQVEADNVIKVYYEKEIDEEEMLDYTVVYYLDGEFYETKELTVPESNPTVSAVSHTNMPAGYYVDEEMSTSLPFTVQVESENVIEVYYVKELDEEEMLDYTVNYYVDGEFDEAIGHEVSSNNPVVSEVSYDNMPEGYYVDEEMSTSLPFTVQVEADNVIKVYYEKETQEPENNVIIKHYTQTGSASEVLALTEYDLVTVTTGSTIVAGETYKSQSIINQGFAYQSSSPVSHEIFANTTSETAIASFTFELHYYKSSGSTGGGGGGGGGTTTIIDPEVPLADLEKYDHFAYVIGYPDGDVRPEENITREEVAMIFYRLLTDDSRNELLSDTNTFTDMENHEWSNRAISTLFNANIIKGYPDGTFKPSEPISRAEFATIAAKFDSLESDTTSSFIDISGHWAEMYITSSEIKGWIKGYPDMTFKPEQDITRAEAMTLINNVLGRNVPEENIYPEAMFWPDNTSDKWYFEAVMEATNSHDYIYEEDGDELWTGLKANKVWP